MNEYYQLKQSLLLITLSISGVIFVTIWIFYTLHIAINYLLGACVGVIYLRMLAKEVEKIGSNKKRIGSGRLALVAGLIIVATQWQQLEVLPIILGFMTYKATIIFYVIPDTLISLQKKES